MNQYQNHYCRVCGLDLIEPQWGNGIDQGPTYSICPCCGAEFGLDDTTVELVRSYRKEWLNKGTQWFRFHEKPIDWSLEEQMKNIPTEWL